MHSQSVRPPRPATRRPALRGLRSSTLLPRSPAQRLPPLPQAPCLTFRTPRPIPESVVAPGQPQCQAKKKNGERCDAPAILGTGFCGKHTPSFAQHLRIAGSLGATSPKRKHFAGSKLQKDASKNAERPSVPERLAQVRRWFGAEYTLEELAMLASWEVEHTDNVKDKSTWHRLAIEAMGKVKDAETAARAQPLHVVLESYADPQGTTDDPA